jgi:hypothetical protein
MRAPVWISAWRSYREKQREPYLQAISAIQAEDLQKTQEDATTQLNGPPFGTATHYGYIRLLLKTVPVAPIPSDLHVTFSGGRCPRGKTSGLSLAVTPVLEQTTYFLNISRVVCPLNGTCPRSLYPRMPLWRDASGTTSCHWVATRPIPSWCVKWLCE